MKPQQSAVLSTNLMEYNRANYKLNKKNRLVSHSQPTSRNITEPTINSMRKIDPSFINQHRKLLAQQSVIMVNQFNEIQPC